MRTFNGLQIFTQQLTNSGQLDQRYVRITGNTEPANIFLNNLDQSVDFFKETNFNVTKNLTVFSSDTDEVYCTGYLPDISNGKIFTIKNNSNSWNPLTIYTFSPEQRFENSNDDYLYIYKKNGVTLAGIKNNNYTGWIGLGFSQGIT